MLSKFGSIKHFFLPKALKGILQNVQPETAGFYGQLVESEPRCTMFSIKFSSRVRSMAGHKTWDYEVGPYLEDHPS